VLLAKRPKTATISATNPIPEFRQLLDTTESADGIHDAATQLGRIIESQITDSFGDLHYARVIEEMGVMRSELIEMEEVGIYNDWVTKLREKVLGGALGGDRKELWREVAKNQVGLVEAKEVEIGGVGEEEAKQVGVPPDLT
jgi:ATP-dependent DNA helicase 2 subunit 2